MRNKNEYFALRVNPELKEQFYALCKSKGFTAGKAVKLFARQFAQSGRLPFSMDMDRSFPNDNSARVSIHMDEDTRQLFSEACKEYGGLSMSLVMRGFMDFCVTNNCFPYSDDGECRMMQKRKRKSAEKVADL